VRIFLLSDFFLKSEREDKNKTGRKSSREAENPEKRSPGLSD